jgi:hypothetical protein
MRGAGYATHSRLAISSFAHELGPDRGDNLRVSIMFKADAMN